MGALSAYPVDGAVMKQVRHEKALETREGVKRTRARQRELAKKMAGIEAKDRTGNRLIDWIYANMDVADQDVSIPEGQGDYGLLRYYRGKRGEFYGKVYGPAMMERGGGDGQAPGAEGAEERMLREMGERNGGTDGKKV